MLTFYINLKSNESRALFMLLRANKIPFEDRKVYTREMEHGSPAIARINSCKGIPVIDNDGFILTERVAIAMYLCREYSNLIDPNWYPSDTKKQARVDEYLNYQHIEVRLSTGLYFRHKFLIPIQTKKDVDEAMLAIAAKRLEACLFDIENVWLKDGRPFLCGDQFTLADLFCSTDIGQPKMFGFDICKDRPNLEAWLERVRVKLNPLYDDVYNYIRQAFINDLRKSKNVSVDAV